MKIEANKKKHYRCLGRADYISTDQLVKCLPEILIPQWSLLIENVLIISGSFRIFRLMMADHWSVSFGFCFCSPSHSLSLSICDWWILSGDISHCRFYPISFVLYSIPKPMIFLYSFFGIQSLWQCILCLFSSIIC